MKITLPDLTGRKKIRTKTCREAGQAKPPPPSKAGWRPGRKANVRQKLRNSSCLAGCLAVCPSAPAAAAASPSAPPAPQSPAPREPAGSARARTRPPQPGRAPGPRTPPKERAGLGRPRSGQGSAARRLSPLWAAAGRSTTPAPAPPP